jgi:hypothetical protein
MATILGLAPGTVKSLARLYDPGTAPRPLHDWVLRGFKLGFLFSFGASAVRRPPKDK